jgi:hypothetical protein
MFAAVEGRVFTFYLCGSELFDLTVSELYKLRRKRLVLSNESL